MIKTLICLLWGHQPFIKITVVVHAPVLEAGKTKATGAAAVNELLRLMRGSTVTSLQCPRCCKIKTVIL